MTKRRAERMRLALLFYALYAAGWLAAALFGFGYDRLAAEQALNLNTASLIELENSAPGFYASTGADPQLVFENLGAAAHTVRLKAAFKYAPGELELFYTRKAGQGFTPRRRAIGVPQNDGSTLYTLPPGQVQALRIDPGSGGNEITIFEITLNPRRGAAAYFVPSLRAVLGFAVLPALALCVAFAAAPLWALVRRRRR